jgi:hypothetical protein
MRVRYELLLQSADPAVPYTPAPVEALLAKRGIARRPDGVWRWQLKSGDVELGEVFEGGQQVATEVRIPLRGTLDLLHEALGECAEIAREAKVRLFDPQLMRLVGATDEGAVGDQYLRTARYAGEMMGDSGALEASIPPPDDRLLTPGAKVLLGLMGLFFLLYMVCQPS